MAGAFFGVASAFSGRPCRVDFFKDLLLALFLCRSAAEVVVHVRRYGLLGTVDRLVRAFGGKLIRAARKAPSAGTKIQAKIDEAVADIERRLAPVQQGEPRYLRLPEKGFDEGKLDAELRRYKGKAEVDYREGKVSGAVYHGAEKHDALLVRAYGMFYSSNPLHPDIFPGVRKMEAECVAMVLDMFNGTAGAGGVMTGGGTESILMACKAYREWAVDVKGITEPEMVVAESAHAAFEKAAHYFKIKFVSIPVDHATGAFPVKKMEAAITRNTIMIVGSAPGFPHGIIDDIASLSEVAKRRDIGLHVDCCLGGFILPFLEKAGFPCPMFDFRLEGVTSISCDTHKYGFAPKGTSVVMYRTKSMRHYQYFVSTDWIGGVYASPSIAGSRSGGVIAGCWAAMMEMGLSGYVESTKKIVGCARTIISGIRSSIPELQVIGEPLGSVVAFRSAPGANVNVYAVGDAMRRRGWVLSNLQNPASLHIACTLLTVPVAENFVADLVQSVAEVKASPGAAKEGQAAMYGMAATVPDRTIIADIAKGFVDCLYVA